MAQHNRTLQVDVDGAPSGANGVAQTFHVYKICLVEITSFHVDTWVAVVGYTDSGGQLDEYNAIPRMVDNREPAPFATSYKTVHKLGTYFVGVLLYLQCLEIGVDGPR